MACFDKDEFERLNEVLSDLEGNGYIDSRNQSLVHLILSRRFYRDTIEIRECYTDGGQDCGIDAVYIDRRSEDPEIHLFQSKVYSSERKAGNPFSATPLDKIVRFFEILKDRKTNLDKVVNPKLKQKILEIREAIDREFPTFRVWLISNGLACLPNEIQPAMNLLQSQDVEIEEFHLEEVVEFCLNSHSKKTNHIFHARDAGVIEFGSSELRSFVGYISALQLYKLLADMNDPKKIDYSVFNLNVRGFLGLNSAINKEIFRTAASTENMHFASFNNGITLVGSQCKVTRAGSDMPKIGIKRMSIVNGAQTCSAIFDAIKDFFPDTSKFEKLSVLFRVFETEDPDLISKIALSTNNQNRINPRDLKANDPTQIKLEKDLAAFGVSYQRKRGFYGQEQTSGKKLDALKAGQILLSYVHADPARAKRDSDSIFNESYHKIFGNVDASKLVEALEWFDLIEERRQYIEDELRIRGVRRTENTFITYGVFHILMLCSLLGGEVKEKSRRKEIIDQSIDIISKKLKEAGEPAFYSYFRNPKYTEELRAAAVQPSLI